MNFFSSWLVWKGDPKKYRKKEKMRNANRGKDEAAGEAAAESAGLDLVSGTADISNRENESIAVHPKRQLDSDSCTPINQGRIYRSAPQTTA